MKVLIADSFAEQGLARLAQLDVEVEHNPDLSAETLPTAVADADVLIVRSTRVTAQTIDASERLKLIIRAGAGYDTIDVARASAEGVFVANCPGKNAVAVAELAMALILSCDRRVPEQTAALRQGEWNKKAFSKSSGLCGRTLGLIGYGTIAHELATRAAGFGMPIIAWSRSMTDERASQLGVTRARSPLEVAAAADVISVHVASTAETRHLIDQAFVDAMKPGAIFVNTSRGAVVDETALASGIANKQLRAGLDVYEGEPSAGTGSFDSALARADGVCGTHHIGASTTQAQEAIAMEAVRIVEAFCGRGDVPNCVNRASKSAATCVLTVRHRNRPGVLAKVFQVLSEAHINVEEMDNLLYDGQEAASARIQLSEAPGIAHMRAIRDSGDDILSVELSGLSDTSNTEDTGATP